MKTQTAQQGFALVVALVMVLVVSLIAIHASQNTSLQNRMAANLQLQALSLQIAEAALSEAEQQLKKDVEAGTLNNDEIYRVEDMQASNPVLPPDWIKNPSASVADNPRIHNYRWSEPSGETELPAAYYENMQAHYYIVDMGLMNYKGTGSVALGSGVLDPGIDLRMYRIVVRGTGPQNTHSIIESLQAY